MKKSLYILVIFALLVQPSLGTLPIASAREAGETPQAPEATTLYVKPGGTGDCTSWGNACGLKPALNAAVAGDEIWVQQGVYKPDFWENLTDFTFVAWVYWEGDEDDYWQRIFDFGMDTTNFMTLITRDSSDRMKFEAVLNGTAQVFNAPNALPTNSWQHVAFTLFGDTATIYLMGSPVASGEITQEPKDVVGDNLWLGRSQHAVDPYFDGIIDEVALFNRALSETEIAAVYSNGWDTTPGKVLALHLEENPASNGTTLLDSFESGYGGILNTDDGTANKSVAGQVGQALSFDGGFDYVTLKTRRQGTFNLKSGVALYGGFPTGGGAWEQRDPQAHPTVLSGDIDGNGELEGNAYHVVTGSGVDATAILDGFTITAGNADGVAPWDSGGGMLNNASSPTLTGCSLAGNSANYGGGMYNKESSSPTLTGCSLAGNSAYSGGGMYNKESSSPSLTNCTFADNWAVIGGGIVNYGLLTLVASTVGPGNNVQVMGGGIYNLGTMWIFDSTIVGNSGTGTTGGAGIVSYGTLTITSTTISNNFTNVDGGGIYIGGGSLTLTNSTITANISDHDQNGSGTGAGIFGGGSVTAKNTIIANNLRQNSISNNCAVFGTGLNSLGYNLDSDGSCGFDSPTDLPNTDPLLGPLADHGGPTLTHAMLPSSPAIDAGSCPGFTADQRGFSRPVDFPGIPNAVDGDGCDIGAFEFQLPILYLPLTLK